MANLSEKTVILHQGVPSRKEARKSPLSHGEKLARAARKAARDMLSIEADAAGLVGNPRARFVKERVAELAEKIRLATAECVDVGKVSDAIKTVDVRFVN